MRDKDQIILENCYSMVKPTKQLVIEQTEEPDVYRVLMEKKNVNVSVYTNDDDLNLDEHTDVYIKFKVHISKEKHGVDLKVIPLEIEAFQIKLIYNIDDENTEEFYYDIPATNISNIKPTFGLTDKQEYGRNKTYIQIAPQYLEFDINGIKGTKGMESRKIVSYAIDPKSVEIDFSR